MSPLSNKFTEKVLARIGKLDPQRVERFVRGVVRERNFFEDIFDVMVEGVVVTDPDGRVLMINRMARRQIGIRLRARVLGRPLLDLVDDSALRHMLSGWDGRRVDQREMMLEIPEHCDLLVTLRSVRDEVGEPAARVMILTDVTEHHRREREQARAEHLSGLAVLTAGVAHEIKNPLNSLRIHGQLLSQALSEAQWPSETQAERAARSAEIILEETQRLSHVVDQFMQAVRPSRPNLMRHSLNVVLRRVLDVAALEERDVEVTLDLDPQLPDVLMDDHQMGQALHNLILNAAESLGENDRRLTIETRAERDTVAVAIADTGCGIPRADLERIFQPYFTTKFNGTGLGLMVVHRIIGDHGGRLLIESVEGEGTKVTVALPAVERPARLLPAPERED
jgi:PAS domain S-box-containing protein